MASGRDGPQYGSGSFGMDDDEGWSAALIFLKSASEDDSVGCAYSGNPRGDMCRSGLR